MEVSEQNVQTSHQGNFKKARHFKKQVKLTQVYGKW